jgi:hypothetical protein
MSGSLEKLILCIGVVLYHWNLSCPPVKKFIIEGLYGPSSPLSRQQCCPSTHCWEGGHMPPYCLSWTKAGYPLKEE